MRRMKLLALDTTEDACSAALAIDGEVRERHEIAPRRHTELILPMLDALLAEAGLRPTQLDALAFGCGPGSFTGVRIASAIAQGIALGADLPVLPVSSLRGLAQGVYREYACAGVLAAFDARMQEIYWGAYRTDDEGIMQRVDAEVVCSPAAAPTPPSGDWCGAGSGWAAYAEALAGVVPVTAIYPSHLVHAQDIARCAAADLAAGRALGVAAALPVYLRDEVAWKKSV